MSLELYDQYWEATISSPNRERERLKEKGQGDAIGAQHPMIQNQHFQNLKRLYEQAGIDDWISRIDHEVSYHEQKSDIKDKYGVEGFEIDQEQEEQRLEALKEKWEEQAPDDAPMTQEERMREEMASESDSEEHEQITEEDLGTADDGGSESSGTPADWEPAVSSPSHETSENQDAQTDGQESTFTLSDVRERCQEAIEEAYQSDEPVLIDALPGLGKSHGAIEAAANTGAKITILTTRGREEQYEEIETWCDKLGLSSEILPSAQDDCPTFNGEHGEDWESRIKGAYDLGITASEIHHYLNLPCQEDSDCPYESMWDFDSEKVDVIIGHYLHGYVEWIVEDRVVVIDEFPENAYLTEIEDKEMVSRFLQNTSSIPFNDYVGLLTGRGQESLQEQALKWFESRGFGLRESETILLQNTDDYHVLAPLAVLALLEADNLGNNWERTDLGNGQVAVHNRKSMEVSILRPPDFSSAAGVVGLDRTPTTRLWNLVFHLQFKREQVLDDKEREAYIPQRLRIIQTAIESIYPYSSGEYVNPEQDAALVQEIANQHGVEPAVISSEKALNELKSIGVSIADTSTYFGNVRGSNELEDEEVGVILGSPHYGDPYIKKWAALFGEAVEGSGKGIDKEYGIFGTEVLHHMRENEVLQAIFRFARDESKSTVYVKTAAIPGWVPRELALGTLRVRTDAERRVIDVLSNLGSASGSEIARQTGDKPNTVRYHLTNLRDEGVVEKTGQNRGVKWHDNGLASINRYGAVNINSIIKKPYKIPIREFGEKQERMMEQYALDEREKERLFEQWEMEEFRSP